MFELRGVSSEYEGVCRTRGAYVCLSIIDNYNKVRPYGTPPINYEPAKYLKLDRKYLNMIRWKY